MAFKLTVSNKDITWMRRIQVAMIIFWPLLIGWLAYVHYHGSKIQGQADDLMKAGDPTSVRAAIPLYQQAANSFGSVPDEVLNKGNCYYNVGRAYIKLKEYSKALDPLYQALALYQTEKPSDNKDDDWESKAKTDQADTLQIIGAIYDDEHNLSQALDAYQQSSQLYSEIGNDTEVHEVSQMAGTMCLNTGIGDFKHHDYDKALRDFQRGQGFYHTAKDTENEAHCWHNIALTYSDLKQPGKAQEASAQEKSLKAQLPAKPKA